MTCIVGLVAEDNNVYIGADSAGVGGYSLTVRKDRKVFKVGDFVIGGTSSFRMLQLLHHVFTPPAYDEAVGLEKYMATAFIDAIRECFKAGGYLKKDSERESGGCFLVGFRGRLFQIGDDFQVGEPLADYDAVGCGSEIARGVLYATPDMQPRKRVELALKGSEAHNIGVRGPFHIEGTE